MPGENEWANLRAELLGRKVKEHKMVGPLRRLSPEELRKRFLSGADGTDVKYFWYWEALHAALEKHPDIFSRDDLVRIFSRGVEQGAHETSAMFWEAFKRVAENAPHHFDAVLGALLDRGVHKTPSFWDALESVIHLPAALSRERALQLLSTGVKTAHKFPEYWGAVKSAVKWQAVLPRDLSGIFEDAPDKTQEAFWSALRAAYLRDPNVLSRESLLRIFKQGAGRSPSVLALYRHEGWKLLMNVAKDDPSFAARVIKETAGRVNVEDRAYWELVRRLTQSGHLSPDDAERILREGHYGARHIGEYWTALRAFSERYPDRAGTVLKNIVGAGAVENPYFWTVFTSVPGNPLLDALVKAHRTVMVRGHVDKREMERILSRVNHPLAKTLVNLAKVRGYYLKTVFDEPHVTIPALLRYFEAVGKPAGKKAVKHVYESLPFIVLAHEANLPFPRTNEHGEALSLLKGSIMDYLSRKHPDIVKYVHADSDILHLPSFSAYVRKHGELVTFPANPANLFHYKFGHVAPELADALYVFARRKWERKHRVYLQDITDLLRALKEEAEHEGMHTKKPSSAEERDFLTNLRSAYEKILSRGVDAELTPEEESAVRNTKLAKKLGLHETVKKMQGILSAKERGGYLRVALTVPQHLGAMDHPGSCMRPTGGQSEGALAITGGPALVFYVEDPATKRPVSRVVYTLWEKDGRHFFVPNHVYGPGGETLRRIIDDELSKIVPVHRDVNPPEGALPARTQHRATKFWKDGKGVTHFR